MFIRAAELVQRVRRLIKKRGVPLFIRCGAMLLLACSVGAATAQQRPALGLDDYRHDSWGAKEGAPAEIDSMAQGADGWIWLGTSTGLYRFDGVTFSRFVPPAGEYFLGRAISAVVAKPNGDLWIGYIFGTGITVLRAGHLHHLRAQAGMTVGATFDIETESDGTVWAATIDGLLRYRQQRWEQMGAASGFSGKSVRAVFLDQHRRLWAACDDHLLVRLRADGPFVDTGMQGETATLAQSPDGRMWQQVGERIRAVPVPSTVPGPGPPREPFSAQKHGRPSLFDREGNLWSKGLPEGLVLRTAASLARLDAIDAATPNQGLLDQPWQLASLDTRILLEDREGNIWVGTASSLERFRRKRLTVLPFPKGNNYFSFALDHDGAVFAVSTLGRRLWKVEGPRVRAVDHGTGAGAPARARLVPASASPGWSTVGNAANGDLLLANLAGVERRGLQPQRLPYPPVPSAGRPNNRITNITDDGGTLWVSLRDRTVCRWAGGRWQSGVELGVPEPVLYMIADGRGGMHFAYKDNRIVSWSPRGVRVYGSNDGLDLGPVTFLHAGADGELIAAGSNGLGVLREGRFHRPRLDDPELLANTSGLIVSANGDHWFNTMRGIVQVSAAQWRRLRADPGQVLEYALFDALQGYPGVNQTSVRTASALDAGGGRLWFIASSGMVLLEPERLPRNGTAPPVKIVALRAGTRSFPLEQAPKLPAGSSSVSIGYTALGFGAPEQMRFRYRLDGVDADWQEVGTRRTAYYANLSPGAYHFHVMAANEDGVWSPLPARVDFELAPAFTQTRWFAVLCMLGALTLAGLLYGARVRHLTRQLHATMLVRQMERERIARGMHDTLLQSMQGLILRIHGVAERLAGHGREQQLLADILDQADHAMNEGRRHVMNLRTATELAIGLEHALDALAATAVMEGGTGAAFSQQVHGTVRTLEANAAEELFYLLREAVLNAFRHANAGRIKVSWRYQRSRLLIEVRDNGTGMASAVLVQGRPGHFGLSGMRERARRLGARLLIESAPGEGTVVQLSVPGRLAYQRTRRPFRSGWRGWPGWQRR